jgi:uncharacterized membrane protein YhhN
MGNIFKICFWIIFIGQLIGRYMNEPILDFIFKPLIMPCLALYLYFSVPKTKFVWLILSAFVFSWFGDIALLLESSNNQLFILGLGFFLLAHLLYIFAFRQTDSLDNKPNLLKNKPYLFIPLILYCMGLFYVLYPNLKSFTIPVILYVIVISLMAIFALNRKNRVTPSSFKLIFLGAVLFVISDSFIALNKFLIQIPYNGVWVMLTYMLAQYLIAEGAKKTILFTS